MMPIRPRLTPAIADVRRAVRRGLEKHHGVAAEQHPPADDSQPLVLVGLSGGADSLALAAATAFEAPRAGMRAGAVIIDHGLQAQSADVAARVAGQARQLGLEPVVVKRVDVGAWAAAGGPEAAARSARYRGLEEAMTETGARLMLLGHTLDDQAETVLLGLARGSGPTSLHGMAKESGRYLRPLLGIRRRCTEQFCIDSRLEPWNDPHNKDSSFARVRVRRAVLPVMEHEIGPGIAEALARTADQLREDAAALDILALEAAGVMTERLQNGVVAVGVSQLAGSPPALRQRIIRIVAETGFGVSLGRSQTLAVAELVTGWRGQKALHMPGIRVVRHDDRLIFSPADGAK